MKKEIYTKPETKISCFKTTDVMTTSTDDVTEPTTTDDNFVEDDPFQQ